MCGSWLWHIRPLRTCSPAQLVSEAHARGVVESVAIVESDGQRAERGQVYKYRMELARNWFAHPAARASGDFQIICRHKMQRCRTPWIQQCSSPLTFQHHAMLGSRSNDMLHVGTYQGLLLPLH
jgi:hypothetical protein